MSADESSSSALSSSESWHLTDQQLRDYIASAVTDEQTQLVEQHLIECETCATRMDDLPVEPDGFEQHIRTLLEVRSVDETLHGTDDNVLGSTAPPPTSSYYGKESNRRRRYRKQKVIGQGGMGMIWQTYDSLVQRPVAMKQLRTEKSYSPKHLARFRREVLLTAKLSHPGTAYVIDYCDIPGEANYVMSLVQGDTLTTLINQYHQKRESGTETFAELISLLNVFISVGNTIAYAHSEGVLHRDIKSDNVMVGRFGEVTLIDWGLAKQCGAEDGSFVDQRFVDDDTLSAAQIASIRTTIEGQSLGTPAFMSPEQATGSLGDIDFRTDTYMLTAMLYEIITGQPPFCDPDVDTVIQQVINQSPPTARERVPDCPATLERLCIRGLAKNRDHRFQTAEELTELVRQWIAGRADRKKADRQFQRFFEMAFDAMGIVDFRRGLQNLNKAWQTNFGWLPAEITGRTHYEMIHPKDQVRAARALSKANKKKEQQEVTIRLLCKDGSYKWSQWSLAPYVEEASVFIIGRIVDTPDEHQRGDR